jgi:colanic acid/amylovoran biosynthesis glycosyltransferase
MSARSEMAGEEPQSKPLSLAYLVSQYPAINHTFILREIRQLRQMGVKIEVASVSAPDRKPEAMTAEEREEAALTYFIKPLGMVASIAVHAQAFLSRPLRYLGGLLYALRLGGANPTQTFHNLLYFAEAVIAGRWMETRRIAHMHTHFSSTVALMAQRVFGMTFSVTIHGPAEFDDVAGFHLAEKVAASSFVIAISQYGRSQIMKACDPREWGKIEVVALGVDPGVYSPKPFRENPIPFELISVARLTSVKGQHILIAAVDLLARQGRAVRLHVVGDGPDRASLEQEARTRGLAERVVFHGWLSGDRVLALYGEADLFVLTSFAEGVPVVLMEAMAREIPCVATRITGVPELIRDGIDGLLVTPSSAEETAAAIATLMDDAGLRRRLAESGRRRVLEAYNLPQNVALLAEVFQCRLRGKLEDVLQGCKRI